MKLPKSTLPYLPCFLLCAVVAAACLPYFSFLKSGTIPSGAALSPPSREHWFGTDDLGIDLFASICYGAKSSLLLSIGSALAAALGGSIIGMLCC